MPLESSFRRMPESSDLQTPGNPWTPAFAGVTVPFSYFKAYDKVGQTHKRKPL